MPYYQFAYEHGIYMNFGLHSYSLVFCYLKAAKVFMNIYAFWFGHVNANVDGYLHSPTSLQ